MAAQPTAHNDYATANHPQVVLTEVTKRFNRDWIFRNVNYRFDAGKSYAITGPNGSGKSTLLQAIAGNLHLSAGKVEYRNMNNNDTVAQEDLYRHVSIVAPYLELVEEMTAKEFLLFHSSFKSLLAYVSIDEILQEIGLEKSAGKQIRYFSSGMKQRVKLAQAIFSNATVLLLDEPCTNLDAEGYALYHSLINRYCSNKLIIVSSNDANEMSFCEERISILDYKKPTTAL